MSFSKKCQEFIELHACSDHEEVDVFKVLNDNFPISCSSIDWNRVENKTTYESVSRSDLKRELISILEAIVFQSSHDFFVMHMDNAIPLLKTGIYEWLDFVEELDFVDTLFLSVDKKLVIHWDFYKNLHVRIIG